MPDTVLPAITLWQPWASLVAIAAKPFEFRGWPAPQRLIGRRVAIHAGARKMPAREIRDLLYQVEHAPGTTGLIAEAAIPLLEAAWHNPHLFPLSAIVCLATLGRPIRDAELATQLGLPHVNDSDRTEHTNWGWPLTDIELLKPPIPARGAQGWWTWTRTDG